MNTEDKNVLHRIDKRLVRVEAKLEDLPEIKKQLGSLRLKVAGTAGAVAVVVTFLTLLLAKATS